MNPYSLLGGMLGFLSIPLPCLGPVAVLMGVIGAVASRDWRSRAVGLLGILLGLLGCLLMFGPLLGLLGLQACLRLGLCMLSSQ